MLKPLFTAIIVTISLTSLASASPILVEDFEAPFPAWESGWLGVNSNLQNYYGVGAGRGNNPDGLWIDDGDGQYGNDVSVITFIPAFGASLSSLSLDVAGYAPIRLQAFDMANALIFDTQVALTRGATTDPGTYSNYVITSTNGISSFQLVPTGGSQVEGNTSIDNVIVNTAPVPEPASIAIWSALGGIGLLGARRRRQRQANA